MHMVLEHIMYYFDQFYGCYGIPQMIEYITKLTLMPYGCNITALNNCYNLNLTSYAVNAFSGIIF